MRVNVAGLERSAGSIVELRFGEIIPGLAHADAGPVEEPVEVKAEVERRGRRLVARGRVAGTAEPSCSRCGAAYSLPFDIPFSQVYEEGAAPGAGDEEGEEDVLPFDGEEVDLAETVRQHVLLALPMKPLCDEACRGLCPRCGKNLNEGPCDCAPEPVDRRLDALRQWLPPERRNG